MKHEISCTWRDGLAFESDVMGHSITMDADPSVGGHNTGARPKPLILSALAGCTGMDVVFILAKMKTSLSYFNIKVTGTLTEGEPTYYDSMHIVYEFSTDDQEQSEKIKKAVILSQEKYCGVSALLKRACPITFEIQYV